MADITIQDVAKVAGVSPSTVSRAFNDSESISSETRKMVLTQAKKMGYVPRQYIKKEEEVVVEHIGIIFSKRLNSLFADPFYAHVLEGVERVLGSLDYHLFFKTIGQDLQNDIKMINTLINDKELAGLILVGFDIDEQVILNIKDSGIPFILVDNDLWEHNIDCVVNDNMVGARRIVTHLIKNGHKDITYLSGPLNHLSLEERYMGYKQALREADIPVSEDQLIIADEFSIEGGYQTIMDRFQDKKDLPTAFFTANDSLAIGAMKALDELGYSIPDDVSIAGFDDIHLAIHTNPPLTTVKTFKEEMGVLAGKRLYELMNGDIPKAVKLVVSVELVVRESTKSIDINSK